MDIMDKWNFHYVRLSAQWDQIEKKKGEYDFNDLDWFMGEADKRGAKVALAVGQKVPRWPECHAPEWAKNLPDEEYFWPLKVFYRRGGPLPRPSGPGILADRKRTFFGFWDLPAV